MSPSRLTEYSPGCNSWWLVLTVFILSVFYNNGGDVLGMTTVFLLACMHYNSVKFCSLAYVISLIVYFWHQHHHQLYIELHWLHFILYPHSKRACATAVVVFFPEAKWGSESCPQPLHPVHGFAGMLFTVQAGRNLFVIGVFRMLIWIIWTKLLAVIYVWCFIMYLCMFVCMLV